jgi:hypothetical protein
MVFLAARGRRRPNDCFGVGALCRTRPKSEQLRIRAALIVWARVAIVEPNDEAQATTPDAKVEKGRRQGELLRRYWQPVCTSDELSDLPKKVKILAENSLYSATRKEGSAPSNRIAPIAALHSRETWRSSFGVVGDRVLLGVGHATALHSGRPRDILCGRSLRLRVTPRPQIPIAFCGTARLRRCRRTISRRDFVPWRFSAGGRRSAW